MQDTLNHGSYIKMVLVTNLVNHHDPWWIIKLVTYPAPSLVLVIVDRLSKAREPPVRRPLEPHSPFKQ